MIPPSEVSHQARAYILSCLDNLAVQEGVRILFAIESGSRAWGFPSADSDYDVRFVYVRLQSDYLSVREFRDVIETAQVDDPVLGVPLDLNGWDIRKALRLGLSSNPVLHEWLRSPVVYTRDEAAMQSIHDLATRAADPAVFRYHYDRLCRSARNQMQTPEGATIKRYCYALRPALMLHWLNSRDGLPPMDMHGLCLGLNIDAEIISQVEDLIRLKATGGEGDGAVSASVLDAFISSQLGSVPSRPEKLDHFAHPLISQADATFLRLLNGR